MKKQSIITQNNNLLNDSAYKAKLVLETTYATALKGGHTPFYLQPEQKNRLVSEVNLLSSFETQDLVYAIFTSKN